VAKSGAENHRHPVGDLGAQLVAVGLPDLGVTEPVSRLGADIRVNDPAAEDALSCESRPLHDTGRAEVFHVAAGTDPPDPVVPHCPLGDLCQCLGHQTAPPKGTRQHVAAIEPMRFGSPQFERAQQLAVAAPDQGEVRDRSGSAAMQRAI